MCCQTGILGPLWYDDGIADAPGGTVRSPTIQLGPPSSQPPSPLVISPLPVPLPSREERRNARCSRCCSNLLPIPYSHPIGRTVIRHVPQPPLCPTLINHLRRRCPSINRPFARQSVCIRCRPAPIGNNTVHTGRKDLVLRATAEKVGAHFERVVEGGEFLGAVLEGDFVVEEASSVSQST